jgi:hypothetical protein
MKIHFLASYFDVKGVKKQGFDHHPIINDGQTQYIMNHKNDWEW